MSCEIYQIVSYHDLYHIFTSLVTTATMLNVNRGILANLVYQPTDTAFGCGDCIRSDKRPQ